MQKYRLVSVDTQRRLDRLESDPQSDGWVEVFLMVGLVLTTGFKHKI